MKNHMNTPFDSRLEALARSVGEEHALHLGNAIGNAIAIAWEALESLACLASRAFRTKPGPGAKSATGV